MIPAALAGWGWLSLRLFALLRAQSIWRAATGGAWPLIAAGLAALLAASWRPAVEADVDATTWLIAAGFEVALGAVVGALVGLPGELALGAGRHGGRVLGLVRSRAWETLHLALAGSLALALDLHRPLLAGLRDVALRWPVGQPQRWVWSLEIAEVADLITEACVLALGLATPVLLAAAVAELVLAAGSRVPLLAAALGALRPWLVAAVALAALGAAWATYPEAWLRALPRP